MYSKLTDEQKKKYEEKAEKAQSVYLKKMELFNNKVFDMPKKPHSAFTLFLSDRMPELKKEKPDETTSDLLKLIAKEWQEGEIVDHSAYNKNAEKDKKRFKKQLAEFKKNGYYLKDKEKEDDEDEKSKKSKSSKKRTSSSKSSSKNSKKGNTSKPKNEEDKSRSKSKKKNQKSGKTQKSQKSQKSKK